MWVSGFSGASTDLVWKVRISVSSKNLMEVVRIKWAVMGPTGTSLFSKESCKEEIYILYTHIVVREKEE